MIAKRNTDHSDKSQKKGMDEKKNADHLHQVRKRE